MRPHSLPVTFICILYLPAPPVFIQEPSDVSMEIGSNVTLPCYVQGYPEPKIKWRRLDNMPVFSRPFSVSSASQLRTGALFISSRLKDERMCMCVSMHVYLCIGLYIFFCICFYIVPFFFSSLKTKLQYGSSEGLLTSVFFSQPPVCHHARLYLQICMLLIC